MTEIGIMQGRLVPRIDGRIQAFPWRDWPAEFPTARALGFDSIEFIFEGPDPARHPLMHDEGRNRVRRLIDQHGIAVSSICADFFMDEPLFRASSAERDARLAVLETLIAGAAAVGARRIEIPCVDRSSLKTAQEESELVASLQAALPHAEGSGVELLLETDLAPEPFCELLERAGHPLVLANFDTGNSAALGYEPYHEVTTLAHRIGNIHIKDRVLGGTTVPLGAGHTNFPRVFAALRDIGYHRPLILQTARDPDDLGVAARYLAMVRGWAAAYLEAA